MRFGVASQIPECAPDLPIGIYCRSGRRCREISKLTSSTRKPEANGLGLRTTRPGDNPKCRPPRSRIQCESSQFGRHASSLPKTQQLLTQGFARDSGSHKVSYVTPGPETRSTSGPLCVTLGRLPCLGAIQAAALLDMA